MGETKLVHIRQEAARVEAFFERLRPLPPVDRELEIYFRLKKAGKVNRLKAKKREDDRAARTLAKQSV